MYRDWEGGKEQQWLAMTSNDSEEKNSTEESIAGATAIYLWLAPLRCSPVANMDIASNETLAYSDIASNETSHILRPTNPQSH